MSEEETMAVEQEAQGVAVATEPEPTKAKEPVETAQEQNWREARRKMQELERQNRELSDAVQRMQVPEAKEEEILAKDDLLTVEQAERLIERRAAEMADRAIKQREAATLDDRLTAKYSDYAEIVSKENVELLKEQEPELAMSLSRLQDDPYAQAVAAYKLMKKLGIGTTPSKNVEKEKAQKNLQKPVSVNAATKSSAIGNVHNFENGLTKDLKAQLYAEMREAIKRA